MKFRLRDRHALLIGETPIINDTGDTIVLVVPNIPPGQHWRVDNRRYPKPGQELEETDPTTE